MDAPNPITDQAQEVRPGRWANVGTNGTRLSIGSRRLLVLQLRNGEFRACEHDFGEKRLTTLGTTKTVADAVSLFIA